MGVTLTDVLLFGKAQSDDVDNATLVIYRRNIMRWSAIGGYLDIIVHGVSPLVLPDAIANSLSYVKAFGGTEQRNIPQPYTQVNYVTNTAQTAIDTGIMIDFAKNYEFELECRAVSGSWYILQSRASASGNVTGIHGETSGSNIKLVVGNVTVCTSAITRTVGNKLYVKATLNAGTATLYVKDETANTEDTQTGSYGTSQPNPTAAVYLLGNAGEQYVDINSDIYMARIKENGVTVMDYVPARQVATAGFYDTVSGTFKTALTPANLSADGNTVPTPDAPMDIVSNNGVLKVSPNLFDKDSTPYQTGGYIGSATIGNSSFSVSTNPNYNIYRIGIQPNTTYTFGVIKANAPYWVIKDDEVILDCAPNSGGTAGTNITITTPANAKYLYLSVGVGGTYKCDDILQLELGSTATPYMPYGQVYTDGTVETINVHGKNLFGNVNAESGYLNSNGDVVSNSSWLYTANYIPVKPSTTYAFNPNSTSGGFPNHIYYDRNKNIIGIITSGPQIFTTPSNCAFMRFSYRVSSFDIQLEEGSTATEYAPYYNGGTATAEMLLKVGDYQDVQSILDGVVTRNVGVKAFDGTEDWKSSVTSKFYLDNAYMRNYNNMPLYCTHYKAVLASSTGTVGFGQVGLFANGTPGVAIARLVIGDSNYTTVESFKQFLADQYAAGTPVILVYPLATPTTESVAGQTLQVTSGDNVLEITQASLDGLELEVEYQAAVTLTVQEVQDANLDNNVEVTIS